MAGLDERAHGLSGFVKRLDAQLAKQAADWWKGRTERERDEPPSSTHPAPSKKAYRCKWGQAGNLARRPRHFSWSGPVGHPVLLGESPRTTRTGACPWARHSRTVGRSDPVAAQWPRRWGCRPCQEVTATCSPQRRPCYTAPLAPRLRRRPCTARTSHAWLR